MAGNFYVEMVTLTGDDAQKTRSYYVRDVSGRELGPVPEDLLANLMASGGLSGQEQFRDVTTTEWYPAERIPALAASLRVRPDVKTDSGVFPPEKTWRVSDGGIVPILLDCARMQYTGWLKCERPGGDVKVVAFRGGRPIDIRSNHPDERFGAVAIRSGFLTKEQLEQGVNHAKNQQMSIGNALVDLGMMKRADLYGVLAAQGQIRLNQVFSWNDGAARFDRDQTAAGLDDIINTSTFDLCRANVTGVSTTSIAGWLGDEHSTYVAVAQNPNYVDGPGLQQTSLLPLETQVLAELAKPTSVEVLRSRLTAHGVQGVELTRTLYFLLSAGFIQAQTETRSEDLAQFLERVSGPNLLDALRLSAMEEDTLTNEQVRERLDALFESAATWLSSVDATEAFALRTFLDDIRKRASSDLDIYILRRSKAMGLNPSDEAVRSILEAEFLSTEVGRLLAEGDFLRARGYARRRNELVPNDPMAQGQLAVAEFYSTSDSNQRKAIAQKLIDDSAAFPNAVELQLLVADLAIQSGKLVAAKRAHALLEGFAATDKRVVRVAQRIDEFYAQQSADKEDKRSTADKVEEAIEGVVPTSLTAGNSRTKVFFTFGAIFLNAILWFAILTPGAGEMRLMPREDLNRISTYVSQGYRARNGAFVGTLSVKWTTIAPSDQDVAWGILRDELSNHGFSSAYLYDDKGKLMMQIDAGRLVRRP